LEVGAGTGGFIFYGAKRNLTFHVREREQVAFIGLNDRLVETGRGLGSKLIARLDVLCGSTLASHVRRRAIQHSVGARAIVQVAGLRVHEHFIGSPDRRESAFVVDNEETRLELIRHLLLHENII